MERKLQGYYKEGKCQDATDQEGLEFWLQQGRDGTAVENFLPQCT